MRPHSPSVSPGPPQGSALVRKSVGRTLAGMALPLLAGTFAMTAGGCRTVGPDYWPPETATPAAWSTPAPSLPDDARGTQDLARWWETFDDPVLAGLVAEAQRGNRDLAQSSARLRQARAARALAGADRFPSLSASASGGRARSENAAGDAARTTSSWSAGLDASWELDLLGGKRRAAEAAQASLEASREDLRDVLVSLLAEVAVAYVDYRSAQVRLAIVQTNLAAQLEDDQIARWRQQANLVSQLDVDQSRLGLEQSRAEIPALRTSLEQSEHRLCTLQGVAPGSLRARLDAGPSRIPVAAREPAAGVPADLLRRRPDVRAAERRLAAQTAQVGVARAARYPSLTLSGSLGLEAGTLGDLLTGGAYTAQGLARSAFTLLDAGRLRQTFNIQTALQEESLAAYQAAVLNALLDVENALSSGAADRERLQALQAAETAGLDALRLVRSRYAAGLADFQAVLDAQRSVLAVQGSLAASQASLATDHIALYKALGGGWSPQPPGAEAGGDTGPAGGEHQP